MDFGDFLLLCIFGLLAVLVIMIIWGVLEWLSVSADRRGVPQRLGHAYVRGHLYKPPYSMFTGKVWVHFPATYTLVVQVGHHLSEVQVLETAYKGIPDGDWVYMTFQLGKNSGRLYVCDFPGKTSES